MSDESIGNYSPEHDSRTAAFLLVVPGFTLIGVGVGLLSTNLVPYSTIGFGAGLLVWGLIVALTK